MSDPFAAFADAPPSAPPPPQGGGGDPYAAFPDQPHDGGAPPKTTGVAGAWDEIKERFNDEQPGSLIGMAGRAYHLASGLGSGQIDPSTPEGSQAAAEAAFTFGPMAPGKMLPAAGKTAPAVLSAGEKAAQTAERLGAPLPKGVASDSRAIQSATAATASVPFVGARIRNAVDATREAAGDAVAQSGIDQAIAANKQEINDLYNGVRGKIDPDQVMPMPRTDQAVAVVKANRIAAGWSNPGQGLEQFENLGEQGASFNGAHRARVDAREAGNVATPNPGYNAADYNAITRAMTGDIRANVQAQGGKSALDAFDTAEQSFGPISEANNVLSRIARQRGPGAGLDELGFNPATGEFSLDKFVTSWNKINPQARPFIPEPGHAQNIEDIFQLGTHIKSSMRERNTSHTSTPLIMMDLARDAVMTGAAVGMGAVSGASLLASGAAASPAVLFMHWLSSPAKASAMAKFGRAQYAFTSAPTTARQAALNIATRNLASNLGVPIASVMKSAQQSLPPSNAAAVPLQSRGNTKNQDRFPSGEPVQNRGP